MTAAHSRWIPTNLPVERTRFVGREAELSRLEALLGEGERLVTLVGPGGSGKTRLARRLGARLLVESAAPIGSVWFVDLAEARSLDELLAVLGDVLEVPLDRESGVEDSCERMAHALSARQPMVLILDNFEQLVELAPATIGLFRARAPGVVFVVTSRVRLGLEGEAQVELGPLDESDALALFEDRARRVFPSFQRGHDEPALRELVARLDHSPLAIELAAARVKVLPPRALLTRLSARLDLLRSTHRDALPRHATLRSALDGSWDLLETIDRAALAACSVFHGTFTLEAAEAVVRPTDDVRARVVDSLESLVEQSLVLRHDASEDDPQGRFRLSETVREYASEKLRELGEDAQLEAETRHADHYLAQAEASASAAFAPWGGVVERPALRELDNLMAVARRGSRGPALTLARAGLVLDAMLRARGPGDALRGVLHDALAVADQLPPQLVARLWAASADGRRLHGQLAEARAELARAESAAAASGPFEAALASIVLSELELDEGNFEAARAAAERAFALSGSADDPRLVTVALHALARFHVDADELARARARCDEALPLARSLRLPLVESRIEKLLGVVAARGADLASAERHYRAAIAIASALSDAYLELTASMNLADVCARRGDHEEALAGFRDGIARAAGFGFRRALGVGLGHVGLILHERESFEASRESHAEGNAIHREMGNQRSLAFGLEAAGLLGLEERRLDDAEEALSRSLEIARASGLAAVVAASGACLASVFADRRDFERAHALLGEATLAARATNRPEPLGLVALHEARVWALEARASASARDELRASARARYEASSDVATHSVRCRIVRRLLLRALDADALEAPPSSTTLTGALLVAADGRWFRRAGGDQVDLATRKSLRLLLLRLTTLRIERPGVALTLEALFEAGWPGERITQSAAFRRVYTAIGTLRDLGLRDVLIRRDDGYLLSPKIRASLAPVAV
jgi:predicted ATPase